MHHKLSTSSSWMLGLLLLGFVGSTNAGRYQATLADTLAGAGSVDQAIGMASAFLEARNYEIVLVVNHQTAAASVDLDLRPTQVLFARPPKHVERRLMRRSETLAIDLPVKLLVFEDTDGSIQFRMNPVGYLVDRHDLQLYDRKLLTLQNLSRDLTQQNGLITVASAQSIDDTLNDLSNALLGTGVFGIPLTLNYGEGAGRHHRHFDRNGPILVVFGNPAAGTPLMQTSQEAALDLPQKMLIWEDRNGTVNITYNDPFFIAQRHNIQGQDARLGAISNALANFAQVAAGN